MPKKTTDDQVNDQVDQVNEEQIAIFSDHPTRPLKQGQRRRTPAPIGGRSLTKQAHRSECDVNLIVRKFETTGVITHTNGNMPAYGDFSNADDYLVAMRAVRQAESDFERLPAHLRAHCDNDVHKFLQFMHDPRNEERAEELGVGDVFRVMHSIEAPNPAVGPPSEPPESPSTPEEASTGNPPPAAPATGGKPE